MKNKGSQMGKAEVLRELQEIDLRLDKLREKKTSLPEKERIELLSKELLDLDKFTSEQKKKFSDEESKQKKIEGELELFSLKIKKEEQKLYSGTVTNPKELADIQKEVISLKQRNDKMETELLEQLDLVEGLGRRLEESLRQREQLSGKLAKTKRDYEEQTAQIEEEIQDLKEKKEKLNSLLDESAVQLYEELRGRKQGLAVAVLKEGVCQGCHVELPAEEVDKMLRSGPPDKEAGELWRCSHCERILIKG